VSPRAILIAGFLLFSQHSLAEWQVVTTKMQGKRALLQKEVSSNQGNALIAIICIPEPTLIVEWPGHKSGISVSIDTVQIDVPKQKALRNGNYALSLKPGHVKGLIKGLELQLEAKLPSGETITAETSLWGFSTQFEKAKMDCSV